MVVRRILQTNFGRDKRGMRMSLLMKSYQKKVKTNPKY